MLFYGIDSTYLLLVLPAVLFALWAQSNVQSTFKKYSKVSAGMTGYDSARAILDANGLKHVKIERVAGNLTDHFDPKANVIRLSQSVHDATTAAAVGVAAHEAGHAVQYAVGYTPMKFRGAIIPITNIGSNLAMPLILLGILLSFPALAYLGIAAFGLSTLFQLVTLPVEFNASGRAMDALRSGGRLSGDEITAAGKVLRAAALTYVAALAVSLANLLRFVTLVNRSRK
ncbi:MAG: zinc metallopeptidase [Clostridia bacterium]|nr:zinc metallopeptidase [Clostridia bacterium]